MAKAIKPTGGPVERVSDISPAAMKIILAKMKAMEKPGDTHSGDPFVKGPTGFEQSGDFIKFILKDKGDVVASFQGERFKMTAGEIKEIAAKNAGM